MSQRFRKLKKKWSDPRCANLGPGKVTIAPTTEELAKARPFKVSSFSVHAENCKCKKERRYRERARAGARKWSNRTITCEVG